MDRTTRRALEFLGVQLAAVVGGIHFYWGFPRLVQQFRTNVPLAADPRPLVFVLSAIVLFAGLALVGLDVLPRVPAYVLGIVLMACYLVGWAYWHLAGHQYALPWIEGGGGHGSGNPVAILAEHLVLDPLEGVSKTAEAALLGILAALLYAEYRSDADAGETAAGGESGARSGEPTAADGDSSTIDGPASAEESAVVDEPMTADDGSHTESD